MPWIRTTYCRYIFLGLLKSPLRKMESMSWVKHACLWQILASSALFWYFLVGKKHTCLLACVQTAWLLVSCQPVDFRQWAVSATTASVFHKHELFLHHALRRWRIAWFVQIFNPFLCKAMKSRCLHIFDILFIGGSELKPLLGHLSPARWDMSWHVYEFPSHKVFGKQKMWLAVLLQPTLSKLSSVGHKFPFLTATRVTHFRDTTLQAKTPASHAQLTVFQPSPELLRVAFPTTPADLLTRIFTMEEGQLCHS